MTTSVSLVDLQGSHTIGRPSTAMTIILTNSHCGYRLGQLFVSTTKLVKLLLQRNVYVYVPSTEDINVTDKINV